MMIRFRRDDPVETWEGMKVLRLKNVPPSFSQHLLDKWNRQTQGNKSAINYIAKFDEYLYKCGAVEFDSSKQTLSRLGQILETNTTDSSQLEASRLEQTYQMVTDLGKSR